MTSKAPSSDPQALAGSTGTPEQAPTNESPHLAAKYWRERNLARLQRDHHQQRLRDVVDEYQKAGTSWDTARKRLTDERDGARAAIASVMDVADAETARFASIVRDLTIEADAAHSDIERLQADLAEAQATIARMRTGRP